MHTRRRILLLVVAGLLSASALLAVGILLFGRFGRTEGRILGTTALLAGYALLALPGTILLDLRRLRPLGGAVVALALLGAALAVGLTWTSDPPESLGNSVLTVTCFAVAAAQTSALAARRRARDPRSVRTLFVVSTALAFALAAFVTGVVWSSFDDEDVGRVIGAILVLDVLAVALQPLLARAQAERAPIRLQLRVESGERLELTVDAADLAAAAAKAIRATEREGRRVVAVEAPDRDGGPVG